MSKRYDVRTSIDVIEEGEPGSPMLEGGTVTVRIDRVPMTTAAILAAALNTTAWEVLRNPRRRPPTPATRTEFFDLPHLPPIPTLKELADHLIERTGFNVYEIATNTDLSAIAVPADSLVFILKKEDL